MNDFKLSKLDLKEGDILVLHTPEPIYPAILDEIGATLNEMAQGKKVKVLNMYPGWTIEIYDDTDLEEIGLKRI